MFFALQALLGLFTAQVALGHTTFTNFFLNGIPQGDGTCVRMSHNPGSATDPVYDVTSSQMACGMFLHGSLATCLLSQVLTKGQGWTDRTALHLPAPSKSVTSSLSSFDTLRRLKHKTPLTTLIKGPVRYTSRRAMILPKTRVRAMAGSRYSRMDTTKPP